MLLVLPAGPFGMSGQALSTQLLWTQLGAGRATTRRRARRVARGQVRFQRKRARRAARSLQRGARLVKGSAAARAHMARLRKMRRR